MVTVSPGKIVPLWGTRTTNTWAQIVGTGSRKSPREILGAVGEATPDSLLGFQNHVVLLLGAQRHPKDFESMSIQHSREGYLILRVLSLCWALQLCCRQAILPPCPFLCGFCVVHYGMRWNLHSWAFSRTFFHCKVGPWSLWCSVEF